MHKLLFLFTSILILALRVSCEEPSSFPGHLISRRFDPTSLRYSSDGHVAITDYYGNSAITWVYAPRATHRVVVDKSGFQVLDINSRGTLVGYTLESGQSGSSYQMITADETKKDFYQPENIKTAFLDNSISINDQNQIVILDGQKLVFFEDSRQISSVLLPEGKKALSPLLLLSDGTAVLRVGLGDSAIQQWTRIDVQGNISVIPDYLLPIRSGTIKRGSSRGKKVAVIAKDEYGDIPKLYISDLTSKIRRIRFSSDLRAQKYFPEHSNGGTQYVAARIVKPLKTGKGETFDTEGARFPEYIVDKNKVNTELQCLFPNALAQIEHVRTIFDNGDVLADIRNKFDDTDQISVIPRRLITSPTKSYCVNTTVKVVGSCAQYFSGLVQTKKSQHSLRCTASITVRDSLGKPVSNRAVVASGTQTKVAYERLGVTDAQGKFQVPFLIEPNGPENSYLDIISPYADEVWHSNTASIHLYGYNLS